MPRGRRPDTGSVLGTVLTLSATGEGVSCENSGHAIENTGTTQAQVHAVKLNGCAG